MQGFEAFFKCSTRGAKLVYCLEEDVEEVRELAVEQGPTTKVNCTDLGHIRDMKNKCLIVSDEELLRGVDYRLKEEGGSEHDGIDLLVAYSFSNNRAYQ